MAARKELRRAREAAQKIQVAAALFSSVEAVCMLLKRCILCTITHLLIVFSVDGKVWVEPACY